jgi:hypothetical protein
LTEVWEKYNITRIAGDKKTANKILLQFIDLLKKENKTYIRTFVDDICSKTLEAGQSTLYNNGTDVSNNKYRIQHPLFKEIILPVLAEQYLNNSALHIKWIGQLEQFFYSDNEATKDFLKQINIDGDFSTSYFFEKSFDLENSQDVLTLILKRAAQDIEYYIHELPVAVLIEPELFNVELKTFRHYLIKYNNKEKWSALLSQWENIAKHWTSYFSTRGDYRNFIEYQKKYGINIS